MKKTGVILVCLMLICANLFSCSAVDDSAGLCVTVLKTGKSDAILIECGGSVMLIDTAEADDIGKVAGALESREIKKIDILLLTHLDKDHIGGAADIVDRFEVDRLYQSFETSDSEPYVRFLNSCAEKGQEIIKIDEETKLELGGAEVKLLPPKTVTPEDSNENSVITELYFGETSFLFCGDAEKQRLSEYMSDGCAEFDVLKVPHHGRLGGYAEKFFDAVSPEYAVITCSEKNPPDGSVLSFLEQTGCTTLLTKDGTVRFVSDGKKVSASQN